MSRRFSVVPTTAETTLSSSQFHVLLGVRLQLPLHLGDKKCKGGQTLDNRRLHRSANARTGLLKLRGTPAETCAARICRATDTHSQKNMASRSQSENHCRRFAQTRSHREQLASLRKASAHRYNCCICIHRKRIRGVDTEQRL